MPGIARVIPWLVLGFALIALVLGLYEWARPPFTDAQLLASRVDTWEVVRSTTRVYLIAFLGLGLISVIIARKATDTFMVLASYAAAVLCLVTLLVTLRNHIVLTQRFTGLTGEAVSPLFGLL
jgi:hypothetical protein